MAVFSFLYQLVLKWARHRHAQYYLAGVSVAESSFFPIPPDIMLVTMGLAKPARVWHYAAITTVGSVVGGVIGYLLGILCFQLVQPYIDYFGYRDSYSLVQTWFVDWGFLAILIAGFTPIPYKIFTIAAGAISMSFPPFLLASLIGRGARFFLVSSLLYFAGDKIRDVLHRYIDRIGWAVVILMLAAYLTYRLL